MEEFYYRLSDLHETATTESAIALDSVEVGEGASLTDKYLLSADDENMFRRLLKVAGSVIYKRIHRRGREVPNSYEFDVIFNNEPGFIVFRLDFPETFDLALIPAIDSQLREALIFHTLAGWFSKNRRNFQADYYNNLFEEQSDQLKSLIEMRTKIKRNSNFY
jgi:hypothetical protein